MMDIIGQAAAALEPIRARGISVSQGWFDANLRQLHITLWLINLIPDGHSEDEDEIDRGIVQVNIWSECDQVQLKNEIRQLMKTQGFRFLDAHDEADTEKRLFTNALRFAKISEYESEDQ